MNLISQPIEVSLLVMAGGLAILFFGRKLFWLYVGVVGMLVGFELAEYYLPDAQLWIIIICGALLGIITAVLAIVMQYVAVGLAGFVGGSYVAVQVLDIFPMIDVGELQWLLLLIPAVIGTVVCILLFDMAIIFLSSMTGAVVLVQLFEMDPILQNVLFVIVAAIGVAAQYTVYSRESND